MVTSRRQAAAYIRFLKLVDFMANTSLLRALVSLEQRIIRIVALAQYKESKLSDNDMQILSELGCHETVRSHFKSLRDNGWIALAKTSDAGRS